MSFRDDQRALNGALFELLASNNEPKRAVQKKKFDANLEKLP